MQDYLINAFLNTAIKLEQSIFLFTTLMLGLAEIHFLISQVTKSCYCFNLVFQVKSFLIDLLLVEIPLSIKWNMLLFHANNVIQLGLVIY